MEQSRWAPKPSSAEAEDQVREPPKLPRETILHSLCRGKGPLLILVCLDLQFFFGLISGSNTLLALTYPRPIATDTPHALTIAGARIRTTVPPTSGTDISPTRPADRSLRISAH